MSDKDKYRAAYEGGIGADRMAMGLSCIPDPLRGDMDTILRLRASTDKMDLAKSIITRLGLVGQDWAYCVILDELTK